MPVLRDLLLIPRLTPIANNVASAMIMVLYYRCVNEMVGWMRLRFGNHSRQFLQMALSAGVVFWPLFDHSQWSWKLNVLLPTTMAARIVYKVCVS
jgi:hypothetical protein